jgi:type IV secretory pathway protease TraF
MSAIKRLVEDILEMYDGEGKTIVEIAECKGLSEDEVFEVVSQYSDSFNVV